jgi:hypothetical protein
MTTYFEILPKELINLIGINLSSEDIESFGLITEDISWDVLLQSLHKRILVPILNEIGILKGYFPILYIDLLKIQEMDISEDLFDIIRRYLSESDNEIFIGTLECYDYICTLYIYVRRHHLYKVISQYKLMVDHI